MNVIDTFSTIHECFVDGAFSMDRWEKYCISISDELPNKLKTDIADLDFSNNILPLLNDVAKNFDKLETAHGNFLCLTDGLCERLKNVLQFDLDVSIVFYLGLCNGAGWATTLNGHNAVLLGIEKILELSWYNKADLAGLIYHELGHIWHNTVRSNANVFSNNSLWLLYREGIAMYIEQLIIDNPNFYHQDKNGWLHWCQSNLKQISKDFLYAVNTGEDTKDFFGDWNDYQGKSDVGYFLGCETIKQLSDKYDLTELANIKESDFWEQLICISANT